MTLVSTAAMCPLATRHETPVQYVVAPMISHHVWAAMESFMRPVLRVHWTHVSSVVATATTEAATASAIVLLLSMNVAYAEVMVVCVVVRACSGRRPDHYQSCAFRPLFSCLQS